MKVSRKCPFCGKTTVVEVNAAEYKKWGAGELIQRAMPTLHKAYRETLLSGLCLSCYEKTYNEPAPGNEASFGNRLGSCDQCDMAVYEKDLVDGKFVCKNCGGTDYE